MSARIEIQAGTSWPEVVREYCIESDLKNKAGEFGSVTTTAVTPFRDIAWSLASEGDVSQPVQIGDGQWAVVQLEETIPREEPEFEDVKIDVGRRLKAIREEELFLEKVAEWRQDYDVQTWPEHLMKATYAPVQREVPSVPISVGGR